MRTAGTQIELPEKMNIWLQGMALASALLVFLMPTLDTQWISSIYWSN